MTQRVNNHISPADELRLIRAQINQLKRRDAELRKLLIEDPSLRCGVKHLVKVVQLPRRVFVHKKLPPHILNDPIYWERQVTSYVKVTDVPSPPIRAGHGSSGTARRS